MTRPTDRFKASSPLFALMSVATSLVIATSAFAQAPGPGASASPTPASAQPTLPSQGSGKAKPRAFPVVETIVGSPSAPAVRRADRREARHPRHLAHVRHHILPYDGDRPALAGVALVDPVPPSAPQPHIIVPVPAFFLDGLAADFTTPPPPLVCQRRPRDPDLPEPSLYAVTPVACAQDIN